MDISSNVSIDSVSWPQAVTVLLNVMPGGNVTIGDHTISAANQNSTFAFKALVCKVWKDWKVNVLPSGASGETAGSGGGWVYSVTGQDVKIADNVDEDLTLSFGYGNGTASVTQNTSISLHFWLAK